MSRRAVLLIILWLMLLAAAFAVDWQVKSWLYAHEFYSEAAHIMRGTPWAQAVKAMGHFGFAAAVAGILVGLRRLPWRRGVLLLICAATALISELIKGIAGRPRPFSDANGLSGWLEFHPFAADFARAKAFPSGHTMLAFATAACLARYYPRWQGLFYALATLVAAERVLEVAHHVSDVVAAAGLGILLTSLCLRLLPNLWQEPNEVPAGPAELEKRVG
jgi:membrane-associated phospholipid phosphatase